MSTTNTPRLVHLSCRIEPTQFEEMEQIAHENERSVSAEVRRALAAHIKKNKQLRKLQKPPSST